VEARKMKEKQKAAGAPNMSQLCGDGSCGCGCGYLWTQTGSLPKKRSKKFDLQQARKHWKLQRILSIRDLPKSRAPVLERMETSIT